MRVASYLISVCLHVSLFLILWFMPQSAPLRLETPPIMISLVEGDPGGNRTPSPILGPMGEEGEGPKATTPPAPQSEIAAPERQEVRTPAPRQAAPSQETPQKPEPKPEPVAVPQKQQEPRPEPKPEPKQEPKQEARPEKKPEPAKEKKQPEKDAPKKPVQKKETPKKQPAKQDPVAAALQQARKATSRASSGDRGNAVEQALAQAQKRASGNRGGGGGEGSGPGGGGLGNVYMGQVMLAVRPNWGFASSTRVNLSCVVAVKVDMQGKVEFARISRSSGNAQFDASAVNSIIRTSQAGDFPPPPGLEYTDLDLVFTMDELLGR